MLVHVDPTNGFISALSLPRDLRVEVPGHGFQKINAAYAFGGAALAIETVQNLTGVDVDHYVEIDFGAFEDMTTSIGGVYVDVDRRYYYDGLDYENIKLAPGYQLLSGATALDYVRFRHDQNTDFGRLERQQRFLRAIREQAMGWDLAFKLPSLVKSLFKNVSTEMSTAEVIKVAYWVVNLRGTQIKQVAIPGDIQTVSGVSYVVSSDKTIQEAVRSFLSPPTTANDEPLSASADSTTGADSATGISGSPIVYRGDRRGHRSASFRRQRSRRRQVADPGFGGRFRAPRACVPAGRLHVRGETSLRDTHRRRGEACDERDLSERKDRAIPGDHGDNLVGCSRGESRREHGTRRGNLHDREHRRQGRPHLVEDRRGSQLGLQHAVPQLGPRRATGGGPEHGSGPG